MSYTQRETAVEMALRRQPGEPFGVIRRLGRTATPNRQTVVYDAREVDTVTDVMAVPDFGSDELSTAQPDAETSSGTEKTFFADVAGNVYGQV